MVAENKVSPFPALTDQTVAAASIGNPFEKTVETFKQATASVMNVEKVQEKMKESMDRMIKSTEQMVSFSQGNVEAVIKSSQIMTSGLQDLSKSVAGAAQASFEEMASTFKVLSGVKSIKEALELQTGYARTLMEKAVAESGKLTDHTMKLTEQAVAPLAARVNVAVETFSAR